MSAASSGNCQLAQRVELPVGIAILDFALAGGKVLEFDVARIAAFPSGRGEVRGDEDGFPVHGDLYPIDPLEGVNDGSFEGYGNTEISLLRYLSGTNDDALRCEEITGFLLRYAYTRQGDDDDGSLENAADLPGERN